LSRPASRPDNDREFVETLARGLAILEAFTPEQPELTLTEAARAAGISPAAARRCLRTLAMCGYVRAAGTRFVLAAKVLSLGSSYLRGAHIEDALMPELRRLVSAFGDSASIGILDGHNVLYIAHLSEQRSVRPVAGVGVSYPAFATSLGRVLLALGPEERAERYLATTRREKLTDLTETDARRLRAILKEVRRQGYAVAVDQLAYGVTALAVPIRAGGAGVVAALNSSGYTLNLAPDRLVAERLEELRRAADRIGETMMRYPALLHSF
jgi:IclR family pca regulon transcriptional regulator